METPQRSPPLDPEKHCRPSTPSSSSSSLSISPISLHEESLTPRQPLTPKPSLSRSIPEVRDGIRNQRDPELGPAAASPGPSTSANLVSWDGPDDVLNPKHWRPRTKWAAVVTVSLFTLISPVASSMVAPALPAIGASLDIPSSFTQALVLSIFVLAYALGPLLWGPLSELYGRVPILQISNFWFLVFNLGCGLSRTEPQMLAFRFLAGIGGSAPLAIGGGVLSDLFTPEERGRALSIYSLAPLLGPAIGPIAGGWIAEKTSWRWVFYSTTIACGIIQGFGWVFLQETYAPALLDRKKKRLMKETGNGDLYTEYDAPNRSLLQALTIALTRPFRLLVSQIIIQVLALYMMYLYGLMYLILSTFPTLWTEEYHQKTSIASLNYISLGVGFFVGSYFCAPLQDRIYAVLKRRNAIGRPEFRTPMMLPGAVLVPSGLLVYAWAAEHRTHWIVPNIGAALFAAGTIIGFQCLQGYIVDSYSRYAASAVGAVTVLRSMAGFGFPLFAPAMYERLGYGLGGTLLAVIAAVIGVPGPVLLWKLGERLRAKSKFTA